MIRVNFNIEVKIILCKFLAKIKYFKLYHWILLLLINMFLYQIMQ